MKTRVRGLLLLLVAMTLIVGALMLRGRAGGAAGRARYYTEDDVRHAIVAGATRRDEILRRFGEPIYVQSHPRYEDGVPREDEILYFSVPAPPDALNGRYGFAGFQVGIKDGVAADWSATTGTTYKR